MSNTKTLSIGGVILYISYDTVVAFAAPGVRFRRDHTYSRTTSKHTTQFGVKNWDQLPDKEFEAKLDETVASLAIARRIARAAEGVRP